LTRPSQPEPSPTSLTALVQQLLLGRLDGLSGSQVAAFILGWSAMLDLLRRTDLTAPDATDEVRAAIDAVVVRIERAQAAALEEPAG
jgi:hypothetical protein